MTIHRLRSICFIFVVSLIFSNLGFSSDSEDKNDWPKWRGTSSNSKADTDGSFKIGNGIRRRELDDGVAEEGAQARPVRWRQGVAVGQQMRSTGAEGA